MAKRKTHEEFVGEVSAIHGEEYTVIGKYTGSSKKIQMRHNVCGRLYEVRASAFISGARCSHCFRPKKRTQTEFESKVYEAVGDEYKVIGKYKSNHSKIKMRHEVCGHEYTVTPAHFLTSGRRCPNCRGGVRYEHDYFVKKVAELSGKEYKVLTIYESSKKHVTMLHKVCGNEWEIRPTNFLVGKRCPVCNESSGEREIRRILELLCVEYLPQYKFDNCRNKRRLPFDFAILNQGSVVGLIEYQGEQHFRAIEFFGGERAFKERQRNDAIKKQFSEANNIPLLYINYDEKVSDKLIEFIKPYANHEPSTPETA